MNTPRATYRLQLHRDFTMRCAAAILDYLDELGATHVYLSPILQSVPGSMHGYDGVDPTSIDEDRGGDDALAALRIACADRKLGIVLDVVPNHLDVSTHHNRWWWDVLKLGRQSAFAHFFDIDWDAPAPLTGRVLAPVLGESLDAAMESLSLDANDDGEMTVRYRAHSFPLRPESARRIAGEASTREESIAEALRRISGDRAGMKSLLDNQHYELAHWRDADERLNYRRFFDITTLAGVRVELDDVFDASHERILALVQDDVVDGLRIDHPDGLRDPSGYYQRLRKAAPDAWIIAEKILQSDEPLREIWTIDGATGYRFLNDALGVLIDPQGEDEIEAVYREFTGEDTPWEDVAFEARLHVAISLLHAELSRLSDLLATALGWSATEKSLDEAIAVFAASFPAYRTYFDPAHDEYASEDIDLVQRAFEDAASRRLDLGAGLSLIRDAFLQSKDAPSRDQSVRNEFVARFQQFTAAVTAKGVEDTAFYRLTRLAALNEVGGSPDRFGVSVEEFHAANAARAERWPRHMLCTSTHDAKRSEDVRARLAVLSEIPKEWSDHLRRWRRLNKSTRSDGDVEIDGWAEHLLYQTLVGAWPISADRTAQYMLKAAREAKRITSWRERDEEYEAALDAFIHGVYENAEFIAELDDFVMRLLRPSRVNSVVQVLLKNLSPGVPDTYQGCELWNYSLVDPDNRRPVDFDLRRSLIQSLHNPDIKHIWRVLDTVDDPGLPKLWTTRQSLAARRRLPEGCGYQPLAAEGRHADRVIAFARTNPEQGSMLVVVAPRLTATLSGPPDASIELPAPARGDGWMNALTGVLAEPVRVALDALFGLAPLALLVMEES